MPAPTTTNDFLSVVRKSGLYDESAFAERYHSDDMLPDDPQQCATELIQSGLLTSFQAKTLLAGKYKGFLLGPYKVLQPIGKGGMGVVYLAEHTSLKRKVAIKILPKEYADDKLSLERFFREARAAAALDHPNIVGIHDITQGAGTHFLVMEYVEGVTLEELIAKTGRMHYAQAVDYIAQAAAGLRHAHDKGFVHRDIKPSNLMVTKDGKVKILDMGLARSFENAADNLTAQLGDGGVAGTADFVSPEQALNDPVDARSDIYSLGATLYAIIAGRPPFTGNTSQKLLQHQLTEPPKLLKTNATVPAELSDVVSIMMAKDPVDRFQSADEVIDALTPWLPAAPLSSTAIGHAMTTKEMKAALTSKRLHGATSTRGLRAAAQRASENVAEVRRNRKLLWVGIGVAGLCLVAGAVYFVASPKERVGSVTKPPAPAPEQTTPVVRKKVPGVLARFDWDSARPNTASLKGVQKSTQVGVDWLPKPWSVATTRSGMTGEFGVTEADGDRVLSLRNTSRNTPGIRLDSDDVLCTLKANYKYRVTVEYRTESGVKAWVEARYSVDPKSLIARKPLPETAGEWATAELDLEPRVEMPLYLSVCNEGRNTERLFLKSIEVADPRYSTPVRASGQFLPLSFDKVATASTSEKLLSATNNQMIEFEAWGAMDFNRVPFHVIDPAGGTKNIILLHATQGQSPPKMPKSVVLPVNARVATFHVLGGVSGWGWPYPPEGLGMARGAPAGAVSVIARVRYADGTSEDHEWKNGEHLSDYALGSSGDKLATMPGSVLAFELKGKRHVRYLTIRPGRTDMVQEIEFIKGPADEWTAPMIVAVTAERAVEAKK